MRSPLIDLDKVIVTSKFGDRMRDGMAEFHPGIDIRVVDMSDPQRKVHGVRAVEDMEILRVGHGERYKEGFVVALGHSGFLWKYIHIDYERRRVGDVLIEGDRIGMPDFSGTKFLHLHFEMYDERVRNGIPGTDPSKRLDPVEHFLKEYKIPWEMA